MDRNVRVTPEEPPEPVALLAEGVDRNASSVLIVAAFPVALLAEGVDRNNNGKEKVWEGKPSPSSRRAWIEMSA